jgi:hypothetical protein
MNSCVRCGQQAGSDARFCTWCGGRLPEPDEQSWLLDPDGPAWWRESPELTRAPRKRAGARGLVASVVLAGAIGAATAAVLIARAPASHPAAANGYKVADGVRSRAPSATLSHSPSSRPSTGAVPTQKVAAQGLSALLAQSAGDRSAVVNAAGDVRQCGPDLARDSRVFGTAIASRQRLLAQLAALSDASALPAGMVQALTNAWQASVQADQDYAAWAQDEYSWGCTTNGTDPNLAAAAAPSNEADAAKATFVNLWNQLARLYGLPTYQQVQLLREARTDGRA